jgi:hypothetical protein
VTSVGWIPSSDSELLWEYKHLKADDQSLRATAIRHRAQKVIDKRAAAQADDDADGM